MVLLTASDALNIVNDSQPVRFSISDPFALFGFIGLVLIFPILAFLLLCTARRSANEEWAKIELSRRKQRLMRASMRRLTATSSQDLESQATAADAPQIAQGSHQSQAPVYSNPVPIVIKITSPAKNSPEGAARPSFDELYDRRAAEAADPACDENRRLLPHASRDLASDAGCVQTNDTPGRFARFPGRSRGYRKLSGVVADDRSRE